MARTRDQRSDRPVGALLVMRERDVIVPLTPSLVPSRHRLGRHWRATLRASFARGPKVVAALQAQPAARPGAPNRCASNVEEHGDPKRNHNRPEGHPDRDVVPSERPVRLAWRRHCYKSESETLPESSRMCEAVGTGVGAEAAEPSCFFPPRHLVLRHRVLFSMGREKDEAGPQENCAAPLVDSRCSGAIKHATHAEAREGADRPSRADEHESYGGRRTKDALSGREASGSPPRPALDRVRH
jgi:hypothetical protein